MKSWELKGLTQVRKLLPKGTKDGVSKGAKLKCFFLVSFFVFSEDFEVDTVFPRISSNALTSALPQIHTQPLGNNFK